jgi:multiple sugar transport system substrate-binding protein
MAVREGDEMTILTRRSVLRGSAGFAAAGMLARPYIARAAATTATVWWVQGFAEEEDVAFKKMVTEYEKASGNTIDYSIIPYAPERQKIISAVTSGAVPDLFQNNPFEIVALFACDNKLIDVSDVVNTQKEEYTEAALLSAYCYNGVEKRRSYYGVPYTAGVSANHIWRSLVEKAGYKIEASRRPGMTTMVSSRGCRRNCANKGRATSMRLVSKLRPTASIPTALSIIF